MPTPDTAYSLGIDEERDNIFPFNPSKLTADLTRRLHESMNVPPAIGGWAD